MHDPIVYFIAPRVVDPTRTTGVRRARTLRVCGVGVVNDHVHPAARGTAPVSRLRMARRSRGQRDEEVFSHYTSRPANNLLARALPALVPVVV